MESGHRWERAMLAMASILPFAAAMLHAANSADGAHDGEVVRAIGLGAEGPLRALDAWVAAPFLLLPVGTAAYRAAMASACMCGLAGALVYQIARSLLAACVKTEAPRLGPTVAAVGLLTVSLGTAWQLDSMEPGGELLAVVLGLAALALAFRPGSLHLSAIPLAMGLAYEPLFGAGVLVTWLVVLGVAWFTHPGRVRFERGVMFGALGAAIVAAGAPASLAWVRQGRSPLAMSRLPDVIHAPVNPIAYAHEQLGWLALMLASSGVVIAMFHGRARAPASALTVVALLGALALRRGLSGAPVLFGLAALAMLMAVAMQALVLAVQTARIPFAWASAAMIVVLEFTFPVVNLDESSLRCADKARASGVAWDEEVTSALPADAVVLLADASLVRHFARARALGELRGDVTLLRLDDLRSGSARRLLAAEPNLAALYRDMALRGSPSEPSLVALADVRPVAVVFERDWDPGLSRHLVPAGAFDLFYPEPRGTPDRRKGIDAFVPTRDRLASFADPHLRQLTATLLRARASALAIARERDLSPRVQQEVKTFEAVENRDATPLRSSGAAPNR